MTPCRAASGADRLALVTATNSGFPVPERDDAAQPGSSSPQASTATPATTGRRTQRHHEQASAGSAHRSHSGAQSVAGHRGRRIPGESCRRRVHSDPGDGVPRGPRRRQRIGGAHRPERQGAARADAPTTPLGSIGGQLRWCSTLRGVDVPSRRLERSLGDLGTQRRDQDPGRHRRFPGVHRRHCAF